MSWSVPSKYPIYAPLPHTSIMATPLQHPHQPELRGAPPSENRNISVVSSVVSGYALAAPNYTRGNYVNAVFTEEDFGGIHAHPDHDAILQAAMTLTIALAVVGTIANILSVLTIVTSRLRNNINSILICSLSCASGIYCSLLLPLQAIAFYQKMWSMGAFLCELHAGLRVWMIGTVLLSLSFIALYRYLHVVHPQDHARYSQSPWFISALVFTWTLPGFFALTPLVDIWGSYHFSMRILQCTFGPENISHKSVTITLGYGIPLVFLCCCYARIGCVVCRSRKRTLHRASMNRKQKAKRDSMRLTFMMALIFVGFCLGTTPSFFSNIFDPKLQHPMVHIWAPMMGWMMYALNPIIYCTMDHQFQAAFKRLLFCIVGQTAPPMETTVMDRQTSLICRDNKVNAQVIGRSAECLNTGRSAECLNTGRSAECLNIGRSAKCLNTARDV